MIQLSPFTAVFALLALLLTFASASPTPPPLPQCRRDNRPAAGINLRDPFRRDVFGNKVTFYPRGSDPQRVDTSVTFYDGLYTRIDRNENRPINLRLQVILKDNRTTFRRVTLRASENCMLRGSKSWQNVTEVRSYHYCS